MATGEAFELLLMTGLATGIRQVGFMTAMSMLGVTDRTLCFFDEGRPSLKIASVSQYFR